jgi:drug/metabolite transporter (DMT)-like permease
MDWLLLSLISAVGFTAMTIVQKRTLERHVNGAVVFNAVAALPQLGSAVVILALWPPDWSSAAVAIMVAAGVGQATVWLLQGYAINRERDISRIVPVLDSHPLLVLIIAVVALGEVLTPIKWIAVLMVIAGAIIASRLQALPSEQLRLTRSFFAVLGAAVAMAVVTVLFKIASAELSILQVIGLAWVVSATINLIIARVTHVGHEMRRVLRSGRALRMVSLAQVGFVVAMFSGVAALSLGPVSLVTAVMGTRPVMLLLWVVISGFSVRDALRSRPEQGGMRFKWASACLVTAGVAVMAF